MTGREPYGVIGVFDEPEPLVAAVEELRRQGYSKLDAFTPFPVPELAAPLDARAGAIPWIVLAGGIVGAIAAYALILYSVEIDYPLNVGGRPLNSWPAYTVLAFEGGILGAAVAGFIGVLALCRLPMYYHPVFNAPSFSLASGARFFLLVRRDDPNFEAASVDRILKRHDGRVERAEP
jgi:hypothetical protein